MSLIRIIPIADESNKSEFIYANLVVESGIVVYEKKKEPIKGSRQCKLKDFVSMAESDKRTISYIEKFKRENEQIILEKLK